MDDRFDFILATDEIMEGFHNVSYKAGSYKAIGQDGNHFNISITSPPNNSVPPDVLNALGKMSDHLPVTLKLEIETEEPGAITEKIEFKNSTITLVSMSEAKLRFTQSKSSPLFINIYNFAGQLLASHKENAVQGFNSITLPVGGLHAGFYLMNVHDKYSNQATLKLIK